METRSTCWLADVLARTSPWPGKEWGWMDTEVRFPSNLSDLHTSSVSAGWFSRTCPVYSHRMTAELSAHFYPDYPDAKLSPPQTDGKTQELFVTPDETALAWHGEYLMLNLPEWTYFRSPCRKGDAVSSLSDILVTGDVPPQYYLSRTACIGILRRAGKRGKKLPPMLEDVLRLQASLAPDDPIPDMQETEQPKPPPQPKQQTKNTETDLVQMELF